MRGARKFAFVAESVWERYYHVACTENGSTVSAFSGTIENSRVIYRWESAVPESKSV